jgi:hypothetical protein
MRDRVWVPFELHTHSHHSDGDFTVDQLFDRAHTQGYQGIALTDHNTRSGIAEAWTASKRTGVALVPGMEWTTFFGHTLLWGDCYFDWRTLDPGNLSETLCPVREAGSIVGVAHPFRPGNPFCTGCFWEYQTNWTDIDYIEVWSGLDPSRRSLNRRAYALWKRLLNHGHRVRALSGRDWHRDGGRVDLAAASFFSLPASIEPRLTAETSRLAMDALREGRVAVSYGPVPELTVDVGTSKVVLRICIRDDVGWGLEISDLTKTCLRIDSNLGILAESFYPSGGADIVMEIPKPSNLRWANVELWGRLAGDTEGIVELIGFSNPQFTRYSRPTR